MADRSSLTGSLRNRWWQNLFGAIGLIGVLCLSLRLIMNLVLGG